MLYDVDRDKGELGITHPRIIEEMLQGRKVQLWLSRDGVTEGTKLASSCSKIQPKLTTQDWLYRRTQE